MSEGIRGSDPQHDPDTDATVAQRLNNYQGDEGRTPAEVRLQAQALAHRSWGKCADRTKRTANGRANFEARFDREANGDPVRAASLRKAYFADLARQGVEARRRNKQARENGAA